MRSRHSVIVLVLPKSVLDKPSPTAKIEDRTVEVILRSPVGRDLLVA
jgi:hypothetical protein